MFAFGSIVLTRFPFTDLSGDKRRPALVVSCGGTPRADVVVCFITSVPQSGPGISPIDPVAGTGLKVQSFVFFGKIVTLNRRVIAGKLGAVPPAWLAAQQAEFFGVFGFGAPIRLTR